MNALIRSTYQFIRQAADEELAFFAVKWEPVTGVNSQTVANCLQRKVQLSDALLEPLYSYAMRAMVLTILMKKWSI